MNPADLWSKVKVKRDTTAGKWRNDVVKGEDGNEMEGCDRSRVKKVEKDFAEHWETVGL